ncbi:MAG: SMC family ATPase, partial [Anaerotignum sp.]|nr:SMC family ATPase [Anaerotignum sp.]
VSDKEKLETAIMKQETVMSDGEMQLNELILTMQKKQGEYNLLNEQLGEVSFSDITELYGVLEKELQDAAADECSLMDAWQQTREKKEKYDALMKQAESMIVEAETALLKAETNLKEKLDAHGFADMEEYFSVLTERHILEAEEEQNRKYFADLALLEQSVYTLKQQCQNREKKDITSLERRKQELQVQKTAVRKEADERKEQTAVLDNLLTLSFKEFNLREKAIAEYLPIMELSKTANGELTGKDKIAFEQYVQGFYFQKILRAANLRLKDMTEGRYLLLHAQKAANKRSQAGLEVEVLDHYTGKGRSVRSLSGGEAFKASLCLALGLSDVIQAHAGGVRIDTMFIDEGFGSLDDRSREHAVEVLQKLSYGDRVVGIISHVSELKETIDKKILVKKGSTGSTVELQV